MKANVFCMSFLMVARFMSVLSLSGLLSFSSAVEGIDSALAFDWERADSRRVSEAVQNALFSSAGVVSKQIPNVNHVLVGEQCKIMASAILRVFKENPSNSLVPEGLVICSNIIGDKSSDGIVEAVRLLLAAVRPTEAREIGEALRAIRLLKMQDDPLVIRCATNWIKETSDPNALYQISSVCGDWSAQLVWDHLMSGSMREWSSAQGKLASRLAVTDSVRPVLYQSAIDALLTSDGSEVITAYALPFQVLLRQSQFRFVTVPNASEIFAKLSVNGAGSLQSRLFMWISLSLDKDRANNIVAKVGVDNARLWCSNAEWPQDSNKSIEARDRIHDFLLLAFSSIPDAESKRSDLYSAIVDRALSKYTGDSRNVKTYANRISLWSIMWRISSDRKFVESHASLTPVFSSDKSPMVWALGNTGYGKAYLGSTFFPTRSKLPPEKAIDAVRSTEFTKDKQIALRQVINQFPAWTEVWRQVDELWKLSDEDKLFLLNSLCGVLKKSSHPDLLGFVSRCVYNQVSEFPPGSQSQELAIEALSYLPTSPELVDRITSLRTESPWPWDNAVDALLTLAPNHPRVHSARVALSEIKHASIPAVLSIFDAVRHIDNGHFPADSWSTILELNQSKIIFKRLDRHASTLAKSSIEFRDPRCLLGFIGAGLDRPTERDEFDSIMYFLGLIDRIDAERTGKSPPNGLYFETK